jgi:cell division septation protein DedD
LPAPKAEPKVAAKTEPSAEEASKTGSKPVEESPKATAKADEDGSKAGAKSPEEPPKVAKSVPAPKVPLPAGKPQVVQKKAEVTVSHFTLQLSAFPDRADADEFVKKIQAAGYKPFVVASEIPGKGVFYRVRVGDFASRQAALDAKAEFERKQRIIAYVAKL